MDRVAEPRILFPLVATLLLAVTWGITFGVIAVGHAAAERAAAISSREYVDTYEAQVVRALRDIDHTLNLVKFWPGRVAGNRVLADLRDKGLIRSPACSR